MENAVEADDIDDFVVAEFVHPDERMELRGDDDESEVHSIFQWSNQFISVPHLQREYEETSPENALHGYRPKVIKLKAKEKEGNLFHLRYSSASDQYTRVSNDNQQIQGWEWGVYKAEDIFRKCEFESQKTYLCRSRSSGVGIISWKIDLGSRQVGSAEFKLSHTVFCGGKVDWKVITKEGTNIIPSFSEDGRSEGTALFKGEDFKSIEELKGVSAFTLRASLRRGGSPNAWQHAQLFRQEWDTFDEPTFEICIHLKPEMADWQGRGTVLDTNKRMLETGLGSDVTLVFNAPNSEEIRIPAHKYILLSRSLYFLPLLQLPWPGEEEDVIPMEGIKYDDFKELLRYMYYEEIHLTWENVIAVAGLARRLLVDSALEACIGFMCGKITCETICELLDYALFYNDRFLKEKTFNFLKTCDLIQTLQSEGMASCSKEVLEKVLSREVVRFLLDGSARELEVFKAADRWAEKACVRMGVEVTGSGKREALGDSLYLIRFPTIPQETFISGILPKGILSQEEVEDITKYYHSENHQLKYPFSTVDRFRIPIQF